MTLEHVVTESKPSRLIYKTEVIIFPNAKDVDVYSGNLINQQIYNKPDSKLTLATGSSPIGAYQEMIREYKAGLDMSKLLTTNLDQYCYIPKNHPLSYERFMNENLFNFVNIPPDRRFIPNSEASDPDIEAVRYEQILTDTGQADLVILRVICLDEDTIEANSRFCCDDKNQVPCLAISQGIANILEGRKIILIAKGAGKAEGIRSALEGPIGTHMPASLLRYHPDTTFILDSEAASLLGK
ncbi:MAG: Glucosamine-6-phosphate deaminase [Microgenomates group bacterium GW2011_GWF1_38_5]|nr:MAG: Glucosamine-6-phosphate deaminase [Microgenomates group bacterium GW2011_GWF1_38_5]